MIQRPPISTKALESLLTDLPEEAVQEVYDFAAFLHQRYASQPPRGSARAILQALEEVGPLEFEEGELDELLADIEAMRELDMSDSG